MDPVAALAVVNVMAGILLVAAGFWLMWERRLDDPTYTPKHTARAVQNDLQRAVSASKREVRQSLHPWSHPTKRHSDKTP